MESKTEMNNATMLMVAVKETLAVTDLVVLNVVLLWENLVSLNVDVTQLEFVVFLILNKSVLNARFPVLEKEDVKLTVLAFSKFFFFLSLLKKKKNKL